MTPERYQKIKSIFLEASASEGAARAALLERACGPDTALREEVEKLLAAQEPQTSDIHGVIASADLASVERAIENIQQGEGSSAVLSEALGGVQTMPAQIAGYRIERVIGSGGMGTVYAAQQHNPRRTVALKVMRPGIASRTALRRFEFEAQVLAHLRHPGIAQVYEAGTFRHNGIELPFFAMEFIPDAVTLTEYAEQKKLSLRARLELFGQICDAVHYGHQKSVIHRDLKPSNVLVDASGHIKVIDFGVARSIDSDIAVTTMQTDVGQLIGTLQYMSPEQVSGNPDDIDIRSDVYALGVVLYQLLTGRLPYDLRGRSIVEASKIVQEQAPHSLNDSIATSVWSRTDRRDLEVILDKALAKEKERRYGAAAELGADLRRLLDHEPIQARPLGVVYQLRKFTRKNRGVVIAASIAIIALIGGAGVATWQAIRATHLRLEAEKNERLARGVNDFFRNEILARASPYRTEKSGPNLTLAEAVDLAAANIETRLPDDPLIQATVRKSLGEAYSGMGNFDKAEQQLEGALTVYRDLLGQDAPETLKLAHALATTYRTDGRLELAEPLYREVLERRKRTLGAAHADTCISMVGLASIYLSQQRWNEAIALMGPALVCHRETLGDKNINTIQTMNALAMAYRATKQLKEAESLLHEALGYLCESPGPDHPDTTACRVSLASVYSAQGRHDEAIPLLREAAETDRRVLGVDHPNHLSSLGQLASGYEAKKDYEAALKIREKAVGICRDSKRLTRGDYANTLSKLAGCLIELKQFHKAEAALKEAYPIVLESFGPTHYRTKRAAKFMVQLYDAWGKRDESVVWTQRIADSGK